MTETDQPKDRAAALLATRKQKMDLLFSDKKFEIVKEVKLEGDQRFQTPFGNKGRNGFALRITEGEPAVIDGVTYDKFVIGLTMLKQAADEYAAVDLPPAPPRKRRTKEQKAADDAREASEKAASAANETPAEQPEPVAVGS